MPNYAYRARNRNGELVEGQSEAANMDAVAARLFSDGLAPISIQEVAEKTTGKGSVKLSLFTEKIQLADLVMFSRQMYSLTRAGVPIIRAISGLAESSVRGELKRALLAVVDDLGSGIELAAAMGRQPNVFTPLYISMIHVGENTGRLDQAFDQISRYLELEMETVQRIKQAMRYPTFVLVAMAAALAVINLFVVPAFANLFASFHAELPLPTRILIGTSNFFVNYWWLLLALLVAVFFGLRHWLQTDAGALTWDRWKLRIPVVGIVLYEATLARFARSFAMCQRAGVPVPTALAVTANAVDNAFVADKVRQMREHVERGENISRTAHSSKLFSPLVLQMLNVGEETGQIDQLLDEVADFYEREVDYKLKRLAQSIEPILIVMMGAMVLVLALGIFLPMWELASAARGK